MKSLHVVTLTAIAFLCSGCAATRSAIPDVASGAAAPVAPAPLQASASPNTSMSTGPTNGMRTDLSPDETQVGRYTTTIGGPTEADANSMAVIATVHFPRQVVRSVGDAVRYVLIRTGYQLAEEAALDARVKAVFALSLPDNQRVLGPYRVDTMLRVLMGSAYTLAADPASRTVTYVVATPSGALVGAASVASSAAPTRAVPPASSQAPAAPEKPLPEPPATGAH